MIQNTQRLVDRVRRYVQDTAGAQQGNTFTDTDVVDLLNEEQDDLIAAMVEGSEDYFGVSKDIAISANISAYPLFGGCLFLRKVQYLGGDLVSAQNPSDMIESRLVEGSDSVGGTATPDQSQYFYNYYGDSLSIAPIQTSDVTPGVREYAIRDPGPLLLEIVGAGGVVDASNIKFSSVDAPADDDILIGTFLDIVAGTGSGQRRRITAWTGATRQATLESPYSPVPDASSKFATESRIVRLFHHMLALGGAIRAKTILEEDIGKLMALYGKSQERFEDFIYKARTGGQRALSLVDFDVI